MVDRYDLPLPAWAFRSFTVVMLVFLVAPALIVVPVSFSSGSIIAFPFPGYTSRWYAEVVTAPAWQAGVGNSLIIGCAAAALSTVIGTQGALGINRLSPRSRRREDRRGCRPSRSARARINRHPPRRQAESRSIRSVREQRRLPRAFPAERRFRPEQPRPW